ncbi:hypothetical protein BSNK01_27660 [Bacillaceae bacterium]
MERFQRMDTAETVFAPSYFHREQVTRVNNFTGVDLTTDTYYLDRNQVLEYQRDYERDQVFFVMEGRGHFFLDNGSEQMIDVTRGSVIYVPAGVWFRCANGEEPMIMCQVRPAGAKSEIRQ